MRTRTRGNAVRVRIFVWKIMDRKVKKKCRGHLKTKVFLAETHFQKFDGFSVQKRKTTLAFVCTLYYD